jgi:hypothetical protein
MMDERGIDLAHTTILRWVQHYTPEFQKRWRRFCPNRGRVVAHGRDLCAGEGRMDACAVC